MGKRIFIREWHRAESHLHQSGKGEDVSFGGACSSGKNEILVLFWKFLSPAIQLFPFCSKVGKKERCPAFCSTWMMGRDFESLVWARAMKTSLENDTFHKQRQRQWMDADLSCPSPRSSPTPGPVYTQTLRACLVDKAHRSTRKINVFLFILFILCFHLHTGSQKHAGQVLMSQSSSVLLFLLSFPRSEQSSTPRSYFYIRKLSYGSITEKA